MIFNENPTATLWAFGYGGLTVATHSALLQEINRWPNLDHWVMEGESLIHRARGRVASQFLETDRGKAGDVLLMVDRDIIWQPGDLSYIARAALEHNAVVGALYPKRAFGEGFSQRLQPGHEWVAGSDEMVPAVYVSSGFVAIPRQILAAVAETLPKLIDGYWSLFLPLLVEGPEGWEDLSEDWAFCHRASALGYKIMVAARPRLAHEGRYMYRLADCYVKPPPEQEFLKIRS